MVTDPNAALPQFDELPVTPGAPPHSAWGLWGSDDELGTLNLLTPERVAAAARLVRTGKRLALNWRLDLPSPPLFRREALQHSIKRRRPFVNDDVYLSYNPQSSSQWDGFTHYGNVTYQGFYNGVTEAQVTVGPDTRNGVRA